MRSHVSLCMIAYLVEWHLRDELAPLLFHDTDLEAARAERSSPVAATEPSPAAKSKKAIKRNANGDRVNSFAGHLGTMTRNTMRMSLAEKHPFTLLSKSHRSRRRRSSSSASTRRVSNNRKGQPQKWRVGSSPCGSSIKTWA